MTVPQDQQEDLIGNEKREQETRLDVMAEGLIKAMTKMSLLEEAYNSSSN